MATGQPTTIPGFDASNVTDAVALGSDASTRPDALVLWPVAYLSGQIRYKGATVALARVQSVQPHCRAITDRRGFFSFLHCDERARLYHNGLVIEISLDHAQPVYCGLATWQESWNPRTQAYELLASCSSPDVTITWATDTYRRDDGAPVLRCVPSVTSHKPINSNIERQRGIFEQKERDRWDREMCNYIGFRHDLDAPGLRYFVETDISDQDYIYSITSDKLDTEVLRLSIPHVSFYEYHSDPNDPHGFKSLTSCDCQPVP